MDEVISDRRLLRPSPGLPSRNDGAVAFASHHQDCILAMTTLLQLLRLCFGSLPRNDAGVTASSGMRTQQK